jgi:hypothetical protein
MTSLTSPRRPAQTEKTTSFIGNTAPRKPCGIFVPSVQRSGLLTRHQGKGTTPVSRIGKLRFTSRDKGMVRHVTNKGGRMNAVVAAEACLPLPLGGSFGFVFPQRFGATAMTHKTNTNGQIQADIEATPTKTAKPVFKYHRAAHPFHRLPFVGPREGGGAGKCFWAVPATGDYLIDCRVGEGMANAFLKFIAETSQSEHSGLLRDILIDMAGVGYEHPNRGHMVGFFGALEPWLTLAVRLRGGRLARVSKEELLDQLNWFINLDREELEAEMNALLAGEEGNAQ